MPERINTKIVCTLGTRDGRDSVESIREFIDAGMNVARVNMSHSLHYQNEGPYIPQKTYVQESERIARIREAAKQAAQHVAIMGDLMGQKIRIGDFETGEVKLKKGMEFVLHNNPEKRGNESGVYINHFDTMLASLTQSGLFLFSDGLLRMQAKKVSSHEKGIILEVLDNGVLKDRQGVVLKGISPDLPSFTEKDNEDLKFLLAENVDFIAVSYVMNSGDIIKIRGLIKSILGDEKTPMIIAKIETQSAIDDIHNIVSEADGIMVARGDLGVRMDIEKVPILQKKIIHLCNIFGKPVITATQMLESMIERPIPTRAEVTDIANAIFDGTDAVMLSGETAVGSYPLDAIKIMRKVAKNAENARFSEVKTEFKKREWRKRIEIGIENLKEKGVYPSDLNRSVSDAITLAAAEIAEDLDLKILMTPTKSGHTARLMSRFRPGIPIVAPVFDDSVARKLALNHGVIPIMMDRKDTVDESFIEAQKKTITSGLLQKNDLFLATSGYPVNVSGTTNLLKIVQVK